MNRILKKLLRITIKVTLGFMLLSFFLVLVMRWVDPFGSMIMVERKLANWNVQQEHEWKDWDEISDNIKIAVIAAEDQKFSSHWGFDFSAIVRAVKHNLKNNKKRGGSTITQQVAKNVFLWSARSFVRKGVESWITLCIELSWSKKRTLEIYLNSIEWGEGIFGIEAASRHYFGVSAKQLTKEQASLLAAILPNPRKWSPVNPNILTQKKAKWILGQMENLDTKKYLKKLN